MCAICRKTVCPSACPNAEETSGKCTCTLCGEELSSLMGGGFRTEQGVICLECVESMGIERILGLLRMKKTAELFRLLGIERELCLCGEGE